jgi:uncharacterized protein YukE
MVSGHYQVNARELTDTASKTGDTATDAQTIQQKIAAAQVPGNAWGLVGLITVGAYNELLGALNDHTQHMATGIQKLSDTIKAIGENYQRNEDDIAEKFSDIEKDLGATATSRAPRGGNG